MLSGVTVYFITGISYVSATSKFWHQKHIPLFVMGEVPVSHKDREYNGIYYGLCSTVLKRYAHDQ